MNTEQAKTDTSLFSGLGLALIGTTCCALPIVLVALGLGSAVASMVAVMPWLTTLSQYKVVTFSLTAAALVYGYWRLHRRYGSFTGDLSRVDLGLFLDGSSSYYPPC